MAADSVASETSAGRLHPETPAWRLSTPRFNVATFNVATFNVATFNVATFNAATFNAATFNAATFNVATSSPRFNLAIQLGDFSA